MNQNKVLSTTTSILTVLLNLLGLTKPTYIVLPVL